MAHCPTGAELSERIEGRSPYRNDNVDHGQERRRNVVRMDRNQKLSPPTFEGETGRCLPPRRRKQMVHLFKDKPMWTPGARAHGF